MEETTELEATESALFDSKKPFVVEILSGGVRRAEVNYPTDAQWIARVNAAKILRTDIGRGKSRTKQTPLEAHDFALYTNRLMNQSDEFDEYEASAVVQRLAKADVLRDEGSGVAGDKIVVRVSVFGGVVTEHVFKAPRRKQVVEFQRTAVSFTATAKGGETSIALEPSGRLYDELIISSTGYAAGSDVPLPHKDAAVTEVVRLSDPEA